MCNITDNRTALTVFFFYCDDIAEQLKQFKVFLNLVLLTLTL